MHSRVVDTQPSEVAELRGALDADGYFIRSDAVPEELVAALRESLTRLLEPEGRPGETIFETITRLHREGDQTLYRLHELSSRLTVMNSLREVCAGWARAVLGLDRLLVDVNSHVIFSIPTTSARSGAGTRRARTTSSREPGSTSASRSSSRPRARTGP